MGAHRARQTSTVGKVAGRGALTAAAALALTGGTASFAFADEVPVPECASEAQGIAADHAATVKHQVDDVAAAGASDLADSLEEHGVDTGDTITDGQHALSDSAGNVADEVSGATEDGAAAADEQAESFLSFT